MIRGICVCSRAREIVCDRLEDVGVASGGVVKPRRVDQGDGPPVEGKCGRFHVDGATLERIANGQVGPTCEVDKLTRGLSILVVSAGCIAYGRFSTACRSHDTID